MHGGILSSNSLITVPELDLLIAAYSHQIYLFSAQQATITDKIALHQHPILSLYFNPNISVVYAIDQEGSICSFRVARHKIVEQLEKYRIGKKGNIREARFRSSREADVQIIALNHDATLMRHVGEFQYLIDRDVSRILLTNEEYIIVAKENSNELTVISSGNLEKLYSFRHTCAVTSLQVDQRNLIIGDEKGKITILIDFLSKGEVKLKQKLQWHVHQVTSLKIDGSYLYSAGEEGVIVLWHLRENKKDFLPRIGSGIVNLQIEGAKIYCFLGDNTIKSIDLENDKAVLHYKVIVNPHGDIVSDSSRKLAKNNLIRVSNRGDKIFLRSFAGRIQEINLFNGINTEYNILNRNFVSRLDSSLPSPHQITNICLTKDNSHIAVVIEGTNCRAIKFYEVENNNVKLVSKVENCHLGSGNVSLLPLSENRFLSYATTDKDIKIWKLSIRRKESILQVQDYFWCCDYSISFRDQLPNYVSVSGSKIVVTYQKQFIQFNANSKNIEGIYHLQHDNAHMIGVYQVVLNHQQKFVVFYDGFVEVVGIFNNSINEAQRLLGLKKGLKLTSESIAFNHENSTFALNVKGPASTFIFISSAGFSSTSQLEIPNSEGNHITDIFWLKERLIALDSSLYFYDLTHERELLQLQGQSQPHKFTEKIQAEEQQTQPLNYDQLFRHYIDRQFKKDRHTIDQNSEILTINPSISASFQMLSSQLFL